MSFFRVMLLLLVVFSPLTASAEQEGIIWLEYPSDGVVLGQGYNLLEDRPSYASCVDFLPVQDPSQLVEYRFNEVNSHTETKSLTNISASGSMKMAILNASARLSFLSNETFSSDTTKFYLTARVTNSTLFASPSLPFKAGVSVPNPAANTITASEPTSPDGERLNIAPEDARNVEKCGHGFVAAIVSGAAIDAFLTFTKSDATSLADIKGGLEADIASVFKVSGNFQQRQESVSKQDSTSISLYRFGGKGTQLAYDLKGLKQSLKDIVKDATQTPKPIRVGILPYRYLYTQPDFSGAWSADSFSEAIDAFFVAKDVFEKTDAAIQKVESLVDTADRPNRKVRDPILLLNDARLYVDLNTEAMQLANRLSTVLLLCRQETQALNATISGDGGGNAGDTDTGDGADGRSEAEEARRADTEGPRRAAMAALGAPRVGFDVGSRGPAALGFRRARTTPLETDEEWRQHMQVLYDRDVAKLSAPLSDGSGPSSRSEVDLARVQYCQTRSNSADSSLGWVEETFLSNAAEYALRLQARELSMRPIYWADLGALRKEKIRKINAEPGLVAGQKRAEIKNVLNSFQEYVRTTGFRRDICRVSFTHPVCGTDEDWIQQAAIADGLQPDLAQIQKELEN
ncbi:hypothetical protein [uncultured Roseibium sp.]|uniref:hypothetical protein n=1 Tax=uncultured Roseibium sp. TaxID=1936171 RepID=UPI00260D9969|nr:hypothetical protein [uncultured Roseibium sp.]